MLVDGPVYLKALHPNPSPHQTKAKVIRVVSRPDCRPPSFWSCKSSISSCLWKTAITLVSQHETTQTICATKPIFRQNCLRFDGVLTLYRQKLIKKSLLTIFREYIEKLSLSFIQLIRVFTNACPFSKFKITGKICRIYSVKPQRVTDILAFNLKPAIRQKNSSH